jgi:hypothetical protein
MQQQTNKQRLMKQNTLTVGIMRSLSQIQQAK